MATYTKIALSASTSGQPITITATTTAGATAIHVGPSATSYDEAWLWASISGGSAATLNMLWGGTASGNAIPVVITPGQGPQAIAPGWLIGGGGTISGWSTIGSVISIIGYGNRIS